jgi:hypothetical protein
MVNSAPGRRTGRAVLAVLAMSLVTLGACRPTAAAPTLPVSGRPSLHAPPVGSGAGGAGSITVAVTKPVAVSGHVDTEVTCTRANHTYQAGADSALVAGYHVAFAVRVAPYHGPDTYPAALVSLTLTGPTGTIGSGTVPSPTTITGSGGSFTLDTTTSSGQTFTASLTWACS